MSFYLVLRVYEAPSDFKQKKFVVEN